MKNKKWNEITRYSKIVLDKDTLFHSVCKGETDFIVPKGTYFICGFWVDAVGIAKTLEDARGHVNDFFFSSRELTSFKGVSR